MALTTPSSQEAQSTFRTWSDHLYCCRVRGLSAAGLHPQFTWTNPPEMIDFISCLTLEGLFGHVLRGVCGGGGHDSADNAP